MMKIRPNHTVNDTYGRPLLQTGHLEVNLSAGNKRKRQKNTNTNPNSCKQKLHNLNDRKKPNLHWFAPRMDKKKSIAGRREETSLPQRKRNSEGSLSLSVTGSLGIHFITLHRT